MASDKSWFDAIIPADLAAGRGPDASAELLRSMLYDGGDEFLSGFAAYLFTHNVQVAILAFALGFALAVPTVLLILMNGCILGAMFQVYWSKGLGFELGGWLAIHGTTELFAIALAGAAGMRIGTRVAFPGELTRMTAAAEAGRVAATRDGRRHGHAAGRRTARGHRPADDHQRRRRAMPSAASCWRCGSAISTCSGRCGMARARRARARDDALADHAGRRRSRR